MTRPMEIVILNDNASLTGGSAAVALASARGLAAMNHKVTLVTCVGPVAPELRSVPNLEVVCLDQQEIAKDPRRLRAFASGLRNTRAVRALRGVLSDKPARATVVHVHSWMKAFSPFALDAVCDMGLPLVVTLHDYFIACPTGGYFDHATGQICTRKPLSLSCGLCNCDRRNYGHKVWRTARTALQNTVLQVPRRVSHYIGVSAFSMAVMRPRLPPSVPVTIVRNPVDCLDQGRAPVAANRAFVYMGRFEEEKGVRLFAEAVRLTGLPAVFIGDGALAAQVRALCPEATFTGWLSPGEIRAHLARARALVFPPLWYETLGLVVIEAAAAGVPSVISDGCAATDIVRDGVNGLHFARGSAASLAQRMRQLAGDDLLASRLGGAAYDEYWSRPWTLEHHVGELEGVYGSVLNAAEKKEAAIPPGPAGPGYLAVT